MPKPRRGAPSPLPPRAWGIPDPPRHGVGQDIGPWGGSQGQRWCGSPRLPRGRTGSRGGPASGVARAGGQLCGTRSHHTGRAGAVRTLAPAAYPGVSAASRSPVRTWDKRRAGLSGRDTGRGPPRLTGEAGCWPWPAGGWWRGVDGCAPPAPLRRVPSCFWGWHQAPFPPAPTRRPPQLRGCGPEPVPASPSTGVF